jgi:hypothetical protein
MEHKKFFVKDFIQYGSPCFGCGKPPSLRLRYRNKNAAKNDPWGSLNVLVDDSRVEIDLSIKYRSSLKIWIFHKTNKFLATDNEALTNYINIYDMYLIVECMNCRTCHYTNNLELQLSNNVVKATTLQYEQLMVPRKERRYILSSNFITEKTIAAITKYDDKGAYQSQFVIDIPLLPKYKLRNQQHLIDKLSTYALFS